VGVASLCPRLNSNRRYRDAISNQNGSPPSEGGVAAASADGVVLFKIPNPKCKCHPPYRSGFCLFGVAIPNPKCKSHPPYRSGFCLFGVAIPNPKCKSHPPYRSGFCLFGVAIPNPIPNFQIPIPKPQFPIPKSQSQSQIPNPKSQIPSLPLDRARRFGRDVIDDAVDTADLACDA
jgi:hypothetical protein